MTSHSDSVVSRIDSTGTIYAYPVDRPQSRAIVHVILSNACFDSVSFIRSCHPVQCLLWFSIIYSRNHSVNEAAGIHAKSIKHSVGLVLALCGYG